MNVLAWAGSACLSDFRHQKLLQQAQQLALPVQQLQACHVHYSALNEPLSTTEQEVLQRLLQYGGELAPETAPAATSHHTRIIAAPRPGTISPWSSKATDIVLVCGLQAVHRVERATRWDISWTQAPTAAQQQQLEALLFDRMVEVAVVADQFDAAELFSQETPRPLVQVPTMQAGVEALRQANVELGLALSDDEIEYLADYFQSAERNPTDAELMMFAQANSEHCRHKIFNADWVIDHQKQDMSLFAMIRNTHKHSPTGVLSAYSDNSSVIQGYAGQRLLVNAQTGEYHWQSEDIHLLMKVETHNHPTAISPFPGAATGAGGEIRDEAATGRGSKAKAGLSGFSVSNLKIPGYQQPWEVEFGKPEQVASALQIMLEGPIGAAAFNNEFGRPNLCGYFRTYEAEVPGPHGQQLRGYHKPIMIAGGMGNIRPGQVDKNPLSPGDLLIVLGGPALLIGLGGGAASSMASGASRADLDFASVQRGNPEIQRRAQEVIDRCWMQGPQNPIVSIHDVGAGGISNALPELVNDSERGGTFQLRQVNCDEPGLSPMEIWCNEAQERYVLGIDPGSLAEFKTICERERCPFAVVGVVEEARHLRVDDELLGQPAVDMPLEVLLGKPPKMLRDVSHFSCAKPEFDSRAVGLAEAAERVLQLPAVASKSFLITIGDRSITGQVVRDQMVGPWQVPVADVAVTCVDYSGYAGEAMAMGERTPLAVLHGPASGRMAVGEALTNIAAAPIGKLGDVRLSANWMAACGDDGEDAALFDTVKAIGMELCPRLGLAIPVGKDSLSMRSVWEQDGEQRRMTSPLSLIVSAFAPVTDVRHVLTPQLRSDAGDTDVILIDLGKGQNRLGASALTQVYQQVGQHGPDLDDPDSLKAFFGAIQDLRADNLLLAYHDRSDGGLLATVAEMSFAGRMGLDIALDDLGDDPVAALFNEELGAVIQVRHCDTDTVLQVLREAGLGRNSHVLGTHRDDQTLCFTRQGKTLLQAERSAWQQLWARTSYEMQALRDNPDCARQEFERIALANDPGLNTHVPFDIDDDISAPFINVGAKPRVAILREQGVNGQMEMAHCFDKAGFSAIDVHMTDILAGRHDLQDMQGVAACGGFSYGDVLGAGQGWAKSILFNARAREVFEQWFERQDGFTLGVCNGCQMLASLAELIPGTDHWPTFVRNQSEQFEARVSLVEIQASNSLLLANMAGTRIPVAVAHGEGRAQFANAAADEQVALRYVDNNGQPTQDYPANPNGSPDAIAGLCSADGRVTIMMPHPERVTRAVTNSWQPTAWTEDGPWLRLFRNARVAVS